MRRNEILYSISVADVQDVARREFHGELNSDQVKSVADKLRDYIDWYEAVSFAIDQAISDGKAPRWMKR